MAESKTSGALSADLLAKYTADFENNKTSVLASNLCAQTPFWDIAFDRNVANAADHFFSVTVPTQGKATNQKSSGRCWLFAALNVIRLSIMKEYNLDEDFQLSQPFCFFYDKLEKANYFLESVLKTLDLDTDSRLIAHLLKAPVNDGGQYDMFVNVVLKYGVVPKSVYPESHASSNSRRMNRVVTTKLREFAGKLRKAAADGKSEEELRALKEAFMGEIHRILVILLGKPPKKFDWTFKDKDKKFHRFSDLTPKEFYAKHTHFKVEDQISLINDPRNPYYKLYTVDYLGNVVGGRPVLYINVPIDVLKKYARKELEEERAVWFGCDVGKFSSRPKAIMDTKLFALDLTFDTTFDQDKADRLRYGQSLMTHAMVFTGVDVKDDKIKKWRVQNSWGDSAGDKGYWIMTDEWFSEYMYQIVLDKSRVSDDILKALDTKPIVLPAWDPMGSLA